MTKEFRYIDIQDNGIVYHDDLTKKYTQEEVDEINIQYYEYEKTFIPEILEDGFIEFPILWDNGPEPIWSSCYLPPEFVPSCDPSFEEKFKMKYNIYIPSYNRAGITMTDKMLDSFGIENYYLCIDPDQYPEYKKHYPRKHIIIRDPSFKSEKKVEVGSSAIVPDTLHGSVGAFNSLLYISKSLGEECYTTMDDDMRQLGMKAFKGNKPDRTKYNKDNYYRCSKLTLDYGFDFKELWNDLEHLFIKLRNKSMLSLDKFGLVFNLPIYFKTGTRSFSFYLSDNRTQVDHKYRQNNDVIISLEMAKYGYVNLIFEGFLYDSLDSQSQDGGFTEVYKTLGTLDKGKVLIQAHPNYSRLSVVYSRPHHYVDYNQYNQMRLVGAAKE